MRRWRLARRGVPGESGGHGLDMRVAVMSADGAIVLRAYGRARAAAGAKASSTAGWARQLGRDLAVELLRSGAAELIRVPQAPGALSGAG